ncbi:putative Dcp1-like decapping protein, partial [Hamiltosporidium tvaerminnensis]
MNDELKKNILKSVLNKKDKLFLEIIFSAEYCAIYNFKNDKWEDVNVEGSLHLYQRKSNLQKALYVFNRKGRNDILLNIENGCSYCLQDSFVIFKDYHYNFTGIWFSKIEEAKNFCENIKIISNENKISTTDSECKLYCPDDVSIRDNHSFNSETFQSISCDNIYFDESNSSKNFCIYENSSDKNDVLESEKAQLAKLYNEIGKRKLHSKLYNTTKNEVVSVSASSRWLKRGNIRPRNEAVFCYIQDRNVFWGADGVCQHCGKSGKTVDHLVIRCDKMLGDDYTRRHNEVVRCLHLLLINRYKFKSSKRIRSHSVQEILDNEYAEIRVDTRIKNDVKIRNNRPDIFILDKKKNKITLIKVGITSQDSLQIVETEKLRKYDLLANELGLIYKCSVEIIPYVMTWDGIVTKYHKSYLKRLEIPMNVEAYIQSIVLKKTV